MIATLAYNQYKNIACTIITPRNVDIILTRTWDHRNGNTFYKKTKCHFQYYWYSTAARYFHTLNAHYHNLKVCYDDQSMKESLTSLLLLSSIFWRVTPILTLHTPGIAFTSDKCVRGYTPYLCSYSKSTDYKVIQNDRSLRVVWSLRWPDKSRIQIKGQGHHEHKNTLVTIAF